MYLTRLQTSSGPRWAAEGRWLPASFKLQLLLGQRQAAVAGLVAALTTDEPAAGEPLAPVDDEQEVWASGVTYLRSREARMHESDTKDIYDKVYEAERPELFFKAAGWRVVGDGGAIRVRDDAEWNVPEPELTLVINRFGEIVGYCAGNDVSSRDIEGANPLYLPQAKVYDGSCALGPGIRLMPASEMNTLPIRLQIVRNGQPLFEGETGIDRMKRSLQELADCLFDELRFPVGALLMTGAGIVPDDEFTLQSGDQVIIDVAGLVLQNTVA